MSTKEQSLDAADIGALSVKSLIKWVRKEVPFCISRADEKIMEKSLISGNVLLYHVSEDDLKGEGLSLGTRRILIDLKNKALTKKRTSEQAGIEERSESETKRTHVQKGSRDTTDTQKSLYLETARRNAPLLFHLAEQCKQKREDILHHFQSAFKGWEDAKMKLSSPDTLMSLPFPFLGTSIPKRFKMCGKDNACYKFMGREVFSGFVDAFERCTVSRSLRDLWVHGLIGYGKSHLLATLVYFLTARGYRVVYLPDCRVCYRKPVRYLQEALLFTWADTPEKIDRIINLRTMKDVEEFLLENWEASVVFVIDQMNALDGPDQSQLKADVRAWLDRCRWGTKTVLSTAADNLTFLNTLHQQNNNRLFPVFGGFTVAEMDAWWDCHGNVDLGEYTRVEVEDLTGKIPLLLDSSTMEGVLDFNCQEIGDVVRQSQRFAFRMKCNLTELEWASYKAYVRACITRSSVNLGTRLEHVDHRYFHEKNGIGYCACGIARNVVTKELARTGTHLFSIADSVWQMTRFISNASVVGYFLERALLQTITSMGIACLDLVGPMPQIVFDGYPQYDLGRTHALYVPRAFNFPAIDALILRLDHSKMKAELMPIQITIAKSHGNSEDLFFKDWSHWLLDLDDYEVSITFLWITADIEYSKKAIEARYRERRDAPEMLVRPAYSSVKIPLKEVNQDVWRKYQDAKNKPLLLSN